MQSIELTNDKEIVSSEFIYFISSHDNSVLGLDFTKTSELI